jgi:hypothetical protein
MTNGTRTILDDVGLVKGKRSFVSFEMAGLAILVDRIKGEAVVKAIAQHFLEFGRRQRAVCKSGLVVTAAAIVDQRRVIGRERSRVKEFFVLGSMKSDDGSETGGSGEKTDEETGRPTEVDPAEIAEIALVLPGDLFLCLARRIHGSQ